MRWTKKSPSTPGWYWWRLDKEYPAVIADIAIVKGRAYDETCPTSENIPIYKVGYWYGPLKVPK
jgi:hypothetical protein